MLIDRLIEIEDPPEISETELTQLAFWAFSDLTQFTSRPISEIRTEIRRLILHTLKSTHT